MYEGISDDVLGARVKAAHRKHLERVEMQTPQWQDTGRKYKNLRANLDITQKQISEYVGISTQVVAKFEKGKSIRSRNMLQRSYTTALELIQMKRNDSINIQSLFGEV